MARLRPKTDAGADLMPENPSLRVDWWRDRILLALRAGRKEVVRPRNSNGMAEILGMDAALRVWRAEQPEPETTEKPNGEKTDA